MFSVGSVWWISYLLLLISIVSVKGECEHEGEFYQSDAVWRPSACTICSCQDPVTFCEPIKCSDPQCEVRKGEHLEIKSGECCPSCVGHLKPCQFQSQSIPHNTNWSPSECLECHCDNGEIYCQNTTCSRHTCSPGEISQNLPGHCCPQCIPAGRSCTSHGKRRPSGSQWQPLPCSNCICIDGETKCLPQQCPPLTCPQGHQVSRSPKDCCPTCEATSCNHRYQLFKNGETWSDNDCIKCLCNHGDVVCHREECDEIPCNQDEVKVQRNGDCCEECVPINGKCSQETPFRYHGDIWNVEQCEYCNCQNGRSICHLATCEHQICPKDSVLVKNDGDCCPTCTKPKLCTFVDSKYMNGETWQPDPCTICKCNSTSLNVVCYQQSCPVCPDGSLSDVPPGQCCGECRKALCSPECETCLPTDPHYCLQCRAGTRLVQDGICVDKCGESYYMAEDKTCKVCDESCKTCYHGTRYHCKSCPAGRYWQHGECVTSCGSAFYLQNRQCIPCHKSCSSCVGPERDQCLSCLIPEQVLLHGQCVDSCGTKYYLHNKQCHDCPVTCRSCLPDSAMCASCYDSAVSHEGQCISECPVSYFPSTNGMCQACHPACKNCFGPKKSNCLSCHFNITPNNGRCLSSRCPRGQFYNVREHRCKDCESECIECEPSHDDDSESVCTRCGNIAYIPSGSSCHKNCFPGFYQREEICYNCDAMCEECSEAGKCQRCFSPYSVFQGQCVKTCGAGRFSNDLGQCQACSAGCLHCTSDNTCVSCDQRSTLYQGRCVSDCPTGFIKNTETRACTANKKPPVLEVQGHLSITENKVTSLSQDLFYISDDDTPLSDLQIYLRQLPSGGDLMKIEEGQDIVLNENEAIGLDDLKNGKIRFIPRKSETLINDKIILQVSDGQLTSDVISLPIYVTSSHPISISVNKPMIASSRGRTTFGTESLNIETHSDPRAVHIEVIQGPLYGNLVDQLSNRPIRKFSLEDLYIGGVAYDNTANRTIGTDMMLLQVTMGTQPINIINEIQIRPKESKEPVIINNNGVFVTRGNSIQITTDTLKIRAMDIESSGSNDIIFTLTPSSNNPADGEILMVVPIPVTGAGRGWRDLGDGTMAAKMYRFLQRDLNEGRIWYRHKGKLSKSDFFNFEVADMSTPPNRIKDLTFKITILDDKYEELTEPTISPGVRLGMTVLENQLVPLTSSHLAYQVADSSPSDIIYSITTLLGDDEGTLEHIEIPFKPALRFTQEDINNNRIIYRPPLTEIGIKERAVSFTFIVTDGGKNKRLPEQRFSIRILPVNNNPPRFNVPNPELVVSQGGTTPVLQVFEVSDADTRDDDLEFLLTVAPSLGHLEKHVGDYKVELRRGERFHLGEIKSSILQYIHHGEDSVLTDTFQVAVSDGVHQVTSKVKVNIMKVDKSAPYMLPTATCHVNVTEGQSVVINRGLLAFADSDDLDDDLTIILSSEPFYGQLLLGRAGSRQKMNSGSFFTQADINQGYVSFMADLEIGNKPITELIYFNVTDLTRNLLPSQILSVLILPRNDQTPVVSVGPNIEVDEGDSVVIGNHVVMVTDHDTPVSGLKVVIDVQPSFGRIINKNKASETPEYSVSSFPLQDLLDGHILYNQSDHLNKEPVWDGFLFRVTDDVNFSPPKRLNFTILLLNDEKPQIITEQLFVQEGRYVTLTNASMFVLDIDTPPEDLVFTLDIPPSHGSLRKREFTADTPLTAAPLSVGSIFTYEDILNELIVYHHGDDEINTDMIQLHLTDGDFNDTKSVNIVVGLINDETPRMTINRGLRITPGSRTVIRSTELKATDLDSEDKKIIYTMSRDPRAGQLMYDNGDISYDLSTRGPRKQFTQSDIDDGLIVFVHDARETIHRDLFKFKLSDPDGNDLIDQDFFITILEDRYPPTEVQNRQFIIDEGSSRKITTDYLSFTDVDSETGSLEYQILDGPNLGHVELTEHPGTPVVSFSQSDLAAGSVKYVHTSFDEKYMDRFVFSVTDGTNEIIQTFYIMLTPVDDSIPIVENLGMTVQEGIRKLITQFELKATDKDTKESGLMFTIIRPPLHGVVNVKKGDNYITRSKFTMADIYENRISYQHDGSENFRDDFTFTVSDGTNSVFAVLNDEPDSMVPIATPQAFKITVLPMDDGSPVVEKNLGLQFLEESRHKLTNVITDEQLKVKDEDTPDDKIVYIIKTPPKYGQIEKTHPGKSISAFTQDDLNLGKIRYVLTGSKATNQDSFKFDVQDSKPNVVPDNTFYIVWSVLSFEKVLYNVTESSGIIQVPVHRHGNLKQYSIVNCKTTPGSATSEELARPGVQDYISHTGQVQFDEYQEMKMCNIIINDDSLYEGPETFYVELESPVYSILGNISKTSVTIFDEEDAPVIEFKKESYQVEETDSYVGLTITRSGDMSSMVSVICSTNSMTATGSSPTGLESGSDFITRSETNINRVIFPPGVTTASCDVKIIDDSLTETSEEFEAVLSDPSMPAQLGVLDRATVVIAGPNDESIVYLSSDKLEVTEDAGTIELEVIREGTDLSHSTMVWCATRLASPPSANPGQDYLPTSSQITFSPGQTAQKCDINILDDEFDARLEGKETFQVFLSSSVGSSLSEPYITTVVISDISVDVPKMGFVQEVYHVDEANKTLNATIMRTGDLNYQTSVICFTRQKTAQVMMDYEERIRGEASRIVFSPGEKFKNCTVKIEDDGVYEEEEIFLLRLTKPEGSEDQRAELDKINKTVVTITNFNDVPTIEFMTSAYSINEPNVIDQIAMVIVKVIRSGDVNHESSVRCSTRDGSAQSGLDYNPRSIILYFEKGARELEFPVDILYNSDIEWHESFTIQLGPETPDGAVLGPVNIATITILDDEVSGSLVLPAPPVVVSLLHYDDVEKGRKIDPSPGYPLVCVSPCDVHHPAYTTTHTLCSQSGINQSSIIYSWQVAMPTDQNGARPPFVKIADNTLFTSTDKMVLDSIYFRPKFKIRCVAQPTHENGNPGVPIKSKPISIGQDNGICKSPVFGPNPYGYQAQSFLANLEYLQPDDLEHPNTIHISVQIPHSDGMLPLISTFQLHNLRFLLSDPVYRQQHVCSNVITESERAPLISDGFLSRNSQDYPEPFGNGYNFPFQFDETLREKKTLNLYRHLNLKSCSWKFDAWYHMTDLVDICGGHVLSDFQVKDTAKTHLTARVPLFVSYLFASAPIGWSSMEHRTEMDFSFYYDSILWRAGLETEGELGGKLQVLRIQIGDDGQLVIDFKTKTKFRGLYVLKHHTLNGFESHVSPPTNLGISFNLDVTWSQATYDSPYQLWRATSNFNLKDYTGLYEINLLPCTVKSRQKYVVTKETDDVIPCTAEQPQRFEVPIAFQQTNRPVPVVFSLNTQFQLANNRKMFLLDPKSAMMEAEDWEFNGAFSPGEKIYGRVLWNPEQDLKSAYQLSIQKVYLCTGQDGFIPTYDPAGDLYNNGPQFGCLQPNKQLKHRFLILDNGNPDVAVKDFNDIPFDAELASNNPDYAELGTMPGVDGFVLNVDPLYKVTSGHQWYLQVLYVIGPANQEHVRFKRSVITKYKRDITKETQSVSNAQNGTNIVILHLAKPKAEDLSTPIAHIVTPTVLIVFLLIACVFIFIFILRKRRKNKNTNPAVVTKQNNLVLAEQKRLLKNSVNLFTDSKCRTLKHSESSKSLKTGEPKRWSTLSRNLKHSESSRSLKTSEPKTTIVELAGKINTIKVKNVNIQNSLNMNNGPQNTNGSGTEV